MQQSNRIARVDEADLLRGLGMLLVIMQHSSVPYITRIILGVHMPLFFCVSGFLYVYNQQSKHDMRVFAVKRFRRLMVPWYLFLLIDAGINFLYGWDIQKVCQSIFSNLLYYRDFWFIPCLFISEIIFHFINIKVINKLKIRNFSVLFLSIAILFWGLSFIENTLVTERLPLTLDISLMAIGFISFGAATYNKVLEYKLISFKNKFTIISGLAFLCVVFVILNQKISDGNILMYLNEYGNYIFAILGAIFGVGCLYMTIVIYKNQLPNVVDKYLRFLSKNSLIIFPIHIEAITHILSMWNLMGIENKWIYCIFNLICVHLIMFPLVWIINNYLIILTGQRKINHELIRIQENNSIKLKFK